MSAAAALQQALALAGLACEVEARDRLAVLVADDRVVTALAGLDARELALRLAATHGFTHLALELRPAVADASEVRRAPLPRP